MPSGKKVARRIAKAKKKRHRRNPTPFYLKDRIYEASARTRTEDLRITNAPLYQLSYTGK